MPPRAALDNGAGDVYALHAIRYVFGEAVAWPMAQATSTGFVTRLTDALQRHDWEALAVELRRLLMEGAPPDEQAAIQGVLQPLHTRLANDLQPTPGLSRAARWALVSLVERCLQALGFAQRFRAVRDERGMSIRELAVRAGIDRGHLYRLSRAAHAPPAPPTLAKLAQALGVKPEALVPQRDRPARSGQDLRSFTGAVQYANLTTPEQALLDAVGAGLTEQLTTAIQGVLNHLSAAVLDQLGRELARQEVVLVLPRVEGDAELQRLVEVLRADPPEVRVRRLLALRHVIEATAAELERLLGCASASSVG